MHRIEYREQPRGEWFLWATHAGPRPEAEASARRLLESMIEDGETRVRVRLNGKVLR